MHTVTMGWFVLGRYSQAKPWDEDSWHCGSTGQGHTHTHMHTNAYQEWFSSQSIASPLQLIQKPYSAFNWECFYLLQYGWRMARFQLDLLLGVLLSHLLFFYLSSLNTRKKFINDFMNPIHPSTHPVFPGVRALGGLNYVALAQLCLPNRCIK